MSAEKQPLENAEEIIEAFGGLRPMSSIMGVAVSTIQGWKKRGKIPKNRVDAVIQAAAENNISLNLDSADFSAKMEEGSSHKSDNIVVLPEDTSVPSNENKPKRDVQNSNQIIDEKQSRSKQEEAIMQDIPKQNAKKLSDSEIQLSIARAERQAVTKSTLISILLIILAVIGAALLLWPQASNVQKQIDSQEQKMGVLENQIEGAQADIEKTQEQQSYFSSLVPQDWQEQMDSLSAQAGQLQQQAGVMQEQIGTAMEQASQISEDVIGQNAGNLEQRLSKLEEHVSALAGNPELSNMVAHIQEMQNSIPGMELLGQTQAQLSAALDSFEGTPEQLGEYLGAARLENAALGETFENIPADDMKAAALLFGLNQFRGALSRDGQPFEGDLAILRKLVGEDNLALNDAITRMAPHGKSGVLTIEGLGKEFRTIAGDVAVASLQGEDVSIQDKAQARFNELFSVEKNGELLTGTDTQNKVSRTLKFLETEELDKAIAEAQSLEGPAADAIAPWLGKAQATMDAQQVKNLLENTMNLEALGQGIRGGTLTHDKKSGLRVYTPAKPLKK